MCPIQFLIATGLVCREQVENIVTVVITWCHADI